MTKFPRIFAARNRTFEIDLSVLEREISASLSGQYKDESIVLPHSFKISNLLPPNVYNGCSYADEDRVNLLNGRILRSKPLLVEGDSAGFDTVFKNASIDDSELIHSCPLYRCNGADVQWDLENRGAIKYLSIPCGKPILISEQLSKQKVIGNPAHTIEKRSIKGYPTYLKSTDLKGGYSCGTLVSPSYGFLNNVSLKNGIYIDFKIDANVLAKTRSIFYDPEGAGYSGEFKKTFVVFGGIPIQSIKDFQIKTTFD